MTLLERMPPTDPKVLERAGLKSRALSPALRVDINKQLEGWERSDQPLVLGPVLPPAQLHWSPRAAARTTTTRDSRRSRGWDHLAALVGILGASEVSRMPCPAAAENARHQN